ncbi:hypothetical protein N7492_008023 [Penicillium capsulatum]|uniref:Uncharacterized protein n=1 Tax=Penicillium capsulatum TaxID=69766 RepID=A0A9W9HS86_9EURO|nr:hypothetical protein N7492_008023 [Penicillium capsulatum]KAJ6105431.1 hypothetical protein N7512_008948 [Penicillium capsulatum]
MGNFQNDSPDYDTLLRPPGMDASLENVDFTALNLDVSQPDWSVQYDNLINSDLGIATFAGRASEASDQSDWSLGGFLEDFPPDDLHTGVSGKDSDNAQPGHISHLVALNAAVDPDGRNSSSTRTVKDAAQPKKSRRLPSTAVKTLRAWLCEHRTYPYPTEDERDELEQQTGLSKRQILNWFTNARRRKLPGSEPITDFSLLSPLERWQNSPPESEPAATSAIIRAARAAECTPYSEAATLHGDLETWSSNSSGSSLQFGAPSLSSYEQSQSSGSELSFQPSNQALARPPTPIPSMRNRRRRRRPVRSKRPDHTDPQRVYQCTFCSDTFRTKFDWRRHEKALHLSVDKWHCAPQGGIVDVDGVRTCVFCAAPDVEATHLEVHNYLECREKNSEARSFSRKDHLQQHLRLMHDVPFHPSMDSWRDTETELHSRCGFCDMKFQKWERRVEHVAEHFKMGADMMQWSGDWGFEPEVEKLVENAIPPYLIGLERRTMDPWRISDAVRIGGDSGVWNDVPNPFNRYTGLHHALVSYLRAEIEAGRHPSDQMIQVEARLIAYGETDPWNQTWADDPAWVAALRRDVELMSST